MPLLNLLKMAFPFITLVFLSDMTFLSLSHGTSRFHCNILESNALRWYASNLFKIPNEVIERDLLVFIPAL